MNLRRTCAFSLSSMTMFYYVQNFFLAHAIQLRRYLRFFSVAASLLFLFGMPLTCGVALFSLVWFCPRSILVLLPSLQEPFGWPELREIVPPFYQSESRGLSKRPRKLQANKLRMPMSLFLALPRQGRPPLRSPSTMAHKCIMNGNGCKGYMLI
jgi:hypothetical protein